jgi:hypothetical protein
LGGQLIWGIFYNICDSRQGCKHWRNDNLPILNSCDSGNQLSRQFARVIDCLVEFPVSGD